MAFKTTLKMNSPTREKVKRAKAPEASAVTTAVIPVVITLNPDSLKIQYLPTKKNPTPYS